MAGPWVLLMLVQMTVLHMASGGTMVTKEPNDTRSYCEAEMNLQHGRWTWKATTNFQGNDEMDEKKWTCEAVRNLQGKELMVKNATKHLHDEQVNNNGWCEAARNSHWKEVSGLESRRKEVSGLESRNTTSSFLMKPFDVVKYDMVRKNDLEVEYDLVKKNDIKLKYDIVAKDNLELEYDMVNLVYKMNSMVMTLATMNKDFMTRGWQFEMVDENYKTTVTRISTVGLSVVQWMAHLVNKISNNMVYYMYKVDYVITEMKMAWQSLCLLGWWLLSPKQSFCRGTAGCVLQMVSCFVEVSEGRVFQFAMMTLLVSCWIGIMAVSNMNPLRHVATPEHMSRVEKRRKKRVICTMRKQFISLMFICSCSSAAAMEQDAMLQRIISLTEAATRAALSAEQTLNQVQGMTSSATSSSEGLQAASRILKAPDTFNGDDPMQFASWRFQFTSWLTFGDSRYTTLLEKVEAMTSSPSIASYDTSEKELAHKLYAVLTSYLRGRCSHIIKAFAKSRDGFAIWYQLMREFEPTSRQRSLALAQALASYPVFSKDKSCLESILVYEQTVQQFEESSSTTYPDELKVATLMRCCNSKLREFLQLNIKDSSTYLEVREHIMNYERVSKSWTQEQVLKALQDPLRPDSGGPTPMEIDRVEVKGKGKNKGKSKGKNNSGSGWSSGAWGFGRGRGRGRDGKGRGKKGRGKGKGKNKGKSKNKGKGNKGKVGQDQCAICYGYGHWSRDCPQRPRPMEVNQVQEQPQQQPWTGYLTTPQHGPHQGQGSQHPGLPVQQLPVVSGATTASSSSFRPPSTSTGSTVRRIFTLDLLHLPRRHQVQFTEMAVFAWCSSKKFPRRSTST